MPNIAAAFRAEIARVARKEVRSETQALKKSVAAYRHQVAALKERLSALERQSKQGQRRTRAQTESDAETSGGQQRLRFSSARLASQRSKLGLSAADFGLLLGVSGLSVYKWEQGKARPRAAQLQAIAAARGIGKREAARRLEMLKAAK